MRCNPISGHQTLYWYQQFPGQGLGLLVRFENEEAVDDSQLPKNRFSALRPEGTDSTLKILRAELGDSAVYFCASSSTTASQRRFLPVQETPGFSSPAPLPAALSAGLLWFLTHGKEASLQRQARICAKGACELFLETSGLKIIMTQGFKALLGDNSRM